MLLGYNTNGFASHSCEDALRVIAGLGYRSVGLTLDHHALNPYATDARGRTESVRTLLRELDLEVVVETGARFLLDPWRKHWPTLLESCSDDRSLRIDFLERAVEVAASLGAGVVSLWSGAAPEGESTEILDARLVEGLSRVCDHAAERGVTIGFEPEPGMHIESMADFDRVRTQLDHPALKLTLDIGHAHLTERSAVDTIRAYSEQIVNVHVEGMRRPRHDHLVPWEGDLDVREAIGVLRETGYLGPATLELSRHSHAAVVTARRAYEFLCKTSASRVTARSRGERAKSL